MAEEERHGAQLHAGRPRGGPERRGLGERGGGRGVQQAPGPRLGRRQDPPAAPEAPPGVLGAPPRSEPRLTIPALETRARNRSLLTEGRMLNKSFFFFSPLFYSGVKLEYCYCYYLFNCACAAGTLPFVNISVRSDISYVKKKKKKSYELFSQMCVHVNWGKRPFSSFLNKWSYTDA